MVQIPGKLQCVYLSAILYLKLTTPRQNDSPKLCHYSDPTTIHVMHHAYSVLPDSEQTAHQPCKKIGPAYMSNIKKCKFVVAK